MEHSIDVVCLGILVADFFPNPISHLPSPGELLLIDTIKLYTGGCAANTAVGLSRLGISSGLVGKVGPDTFGRFIKQDMQDRGIDVSHIADSKRMETSKTIILTVKDEDRRFLHLRGSNSDFSLEDVDLEYAASAKALYVGGYLGMPNFLEEALITVFEYVKKRGVRTILDVITPGGEEYLPQFRNILPLVDVFLPNNDEGKLISGENNPEKQADLFHKMGAHVVVITMGEQGVIAKSDNETIRAGTYPVPFVDGSGGGDAFDAGFIYSILNGFSLKETIVRASAMGASCVQELGCTTGLFSKEELEDFVSGNNLKMEVHRG